MTKNELEILVSKVRGLDPNHSINRDEEWDSLDHLAIITALSKIKNAKIEKLDLSEANSLTKLYKLMLDE